MESNGSLLTGKKPEVALKILYYPLPYPLLKNTKITLKQKTKSLFCLWISNQKLNAYLKEIADFCNIKKHLTFHVARHTFATTVTLTNGIPIESVSSMLGHKSIKTTQIYAKVVQKKVSEDMRLLKNKYSSENKLPDRSSHTLNS